MDKLKLALVFCNNLFRQILTIFVFAIFIMLIWNKFITSELCIGTASDHFGGWVVLSAAINIFLGNIYHGWIINWHWDRFILMTAIIACFTYFGLFF